VVSCRAEGPAVPGGRRRLLDPPARRGSHRPPVHRAAFGEAYYGTRSKDYEFGVVELKLNADGEGATIPAARLSLDAEGKIVVETLPYATGPQRLLGVRQWKDKKKDKK
jgi:hypothetical protein